jgi:hypothetical protein
VFAVSVALLILTVVNATAGDTGAVVRGETGPMMAPVMCFAPGTSDLVVAEAMARAARAQERLSLTPPPVFGPKFQFSDGSRWSSTATQGSGLGQGDPTILTWSIVPDGTPISGYFEPDSNSTLRAHLTSIYGTQAAWLAVFQQVFDRWSELTGITYVYEPNDDGAGLPGPSGSVGVRGDIRIGGHPIDGNSNVLAYNYYPNNGDMVIDTPDSFFDNTGSNSIRLRNVLAHEHGHGLGLAHVCPVNQTKLMEPYVSTSFDGPQHDDILAANRGYGDRLEHDDSVGGAAAPGSLPTTLTNLSIDDNDDVDVLALTVGSGMALDLSLRPVGATYLSGPQNSNGSCSAGTSFNSLTIQDLEVQVLATNGVSVLASADASGAGGEETLSSVVLSSGAGTYYVRVAGGSTNAAQLYDLELTTGSAVEIFSDGFSSGTTSAWSTMVP